MKAKIISIKILIISLGLLMLNACNNFPGFQTAQTSDEMMTKQQLLTELVRLDRAEKELNFKRSRGSSDIASTLFWLPGMANTQIEPSDALDLISQRRARLNTLYNRKFGSQMLAQNPDSGYSNTRNYPDYNNLAQRDTYYYADEYQASNNLADNSEYAKDNNYQGRYADEYIENYLDSYQEYPRRESPQARRSAPQVAYDNREYNRQPTERYDNRRYQRAPARDYPRDAYPRDRVRDERNYYDEPLASRSRAREYYSDDEMRYEG